MRLTSLSHFRIFESKDGRSIDGELGMRLWPEGAREEYGIEDPRITRINGSFYITYVAVSQHGVATALASTEDFHTFLRHGLIFPTNNKDVVLFPERLGGEFWALHRPTGDTAFCRPEIWLARSPDLRHWGRHEVLASGAFTWESDRIGPGPPPIQTPWGWLVIHHGSSGVADEQVGYYSVGALLLDHDNPSQILQRTPEPILLPSLDFECEGFVRNVIFPTGTLLQGDLLQIFYGAADTAIGLTELTLTDIHHALAPWSESK